MQATDNIEITRVESDGKLEGLLIHDQRRSPMDPESDNWDISIEWSDYITRDKTM